MRRLATLVLALALHPSAAAPAQSHPGEEHEVRTLLFNYVLPRVTISAGDRLVLTNLDRDLHSLTAVASAPNGAPLFDTEWGGVAFLHTSPVGGVPTLPSGEYAFYCRFHAEVLTMRGVLEVR